MAGAYCHYCDRRCFVLRRLPDGSWQGHMATCREGMAHDRRATGHDHTTAINTASDPGSAVHPAKNDPAEPGLSNQPTDSSERTPMVSDHTIETAAPATEPVRLEALRELRAARDVMGRWTDLIRQRAAARVGSAAAADVVTDPAYRAAIALYCEVSEAIAGFALHGDRLPGGDQ